MFLEVDHELVGLGGVDRSPAVGVAFARRRLSSPFQGTLMVGRGKIIHRPCELSA